MKTHYGMIVPTTNDDRRIPYGRPKNDEAPRRSLKLTLQVTMIRWWIPRYVVITLARVLSFSNDQY